MSVGENTKLQRNEGERQVYVCSQTMACQCYELLGRYQEGYLLGKSLLQGKLNDEERKDIGHLYALNDYEIEEKNDNGFGIAPLCDWSRCISTGGAKKIVNSGVFDKRTSM